MKARDMQASPEQMALIKAISKVMRDYLDAHPDAKSIETVAVMGVAVGLFISNAPDFERQLARDSAVTSLDGAILDGIAAREAEAKASTHH